MNFELDDEQRQLHDSVRRLLADHCRFEQRRAIASSAEGRSTGLWERLSELGVSALRVPLAQGGFGLGMGDMFPVLQACGGSLVTEPVLATAVLAATALGLANDERCAASLLPGVADGSRIVGWAHEEPGAHQADCWVETRAHRRAGSWVLSGHKSTVLHGAFAQQFIVSARVAAEPDEIDGRALFVVDARASGLQRRDFRLLDDTPASELLLHAVEGAPVGDPHRSEYASSLINSTLSAGIAAACADMLGAAETAFHLSIDYLNVRQQFGRPIGANQALRHRAADMLVGLEMARSMAMAAAIAADRPEAEDSATDLKRAKLIVGRYARRVCEDAVQCHGGIGMTEEYAVGHYLRRVHVMDHLFGDSYAHARRLAAPA
jgi:pimeloyl-CoA dehydrogenase